MSDVPPVSAPCAIVADDDEFFRIALTSILTRQLGFSEVHETDSLDEALERLNDTEGASRVTLALFDLSMPGMESAASLSAVRECFPDVRVAVVSASSERPDILQALGAGVHGYIPKRLGVTELCRALQLIMSGQIFVPPSLADIGSAPHPQDQIGPARHGGAAAEVGTNSAGEAATLTQRQRDVLALLTEGRSNKDIARRLKLGEGTVKVHVAALLRNLGVQNRSAAAVAGARLLQTSEPKTDLPPRSASPPR